MILRVDIKLVLENDAGGVEGQSDSLAAAGTIRGDAEYVKTYFAHAQPPSRADD